MVGEWNLFSLALNWGYLWDESGSLFAFQELFDMAMEIVFLEEEIQLISGMP